MFGDRPCPGCRRILEKRYDRRDDRIVSVYRCWDCAKDWESCRGCGGVVVEKPRPVDLFTSRVLEIVRICASCRQEAPKSA